MLRKKRNLQDKTVASLLNDASACRMDVHGLTEHLADYFANPTEPPAAGERGTPSSLSSDSDSGRFINIIKGNQVTELGLYPYYLLKTCFEKKVRAKKARLL